MSMTIKEAITELKYESEFIEARIGQLIMEIDHKEKDIKNQEERLRFIRAKIKDLEKGR